MEKSTDHFIALIECNRILYDKNSKDFKNVVKKDEAWARITKNCVISVDEAKKRYASLRQKYCREKQKIEIQRRTKSKPLYPWIFYDRFQFLDEFIRPRITYTNDSGFEEMYGSSSRPDDETTMSIAGQNASTNENQSQMEGAQMEDFNLDDINDGNVASNGGGSNQGLVLYNPENAQDHNSFQFIDTSGSANIEILSRYSGELSMLTPPDIEIDEAETVVRDSTSNAPNLSRPDNSSNGNILQYQTDTDARILPISSQSDSFRRPQETVPITKKPPAAKSNAHHGRVPNNTSQSVATSSSTNEQSTESIRHKLDSCIASLSAKISEKHQRSPHAPFLAYLGTKLPNVPKAQIPTLEKRILDLVDSFIP